MEEATFQGYIAVLIDAAVRIPASAGEYVGRLVTITAPGLTAPVLTNTYPRNCRDIANSGASQSGKYDIFNSANKPFSVYCDLQSETGFVWALIQSLSFANRATYKDKGFSTDFPVNDNNNEPDWNSYRLSLSHMQSLSNHSTHLRVTCNLPADE